MQNPVYYVYCKLKFPFFKYNVSAFSFLMSNIFLINQNQEQ